MKIAYLIDSSLTNGGAPQSTMILANEMANHGHQVYVIMPQTKDIYENKNISLIKIPEFKDVFPFELANPLGAFRLYKILVKVIKEIRPDVLHAQMPRAARAVGMAKLIRRINIPAIYTERELVKQQRKIYQWMYRIFVNSCYEHIICLSQNSTSFWENNRGMGVTVIPNCGGGIYDTYKEEDVQEAYESLNISKTKGRLRLLFVGRLIRTKRWSLVYDIIKNLNCKYPDLFEFYLAVIYTDSLIYKKQLQLVEDVARESNVYVYRNVDMNTMRRLYDIADIHVITSEIESFGRTAIEAMSRRTLVLSTNAGSIVETIGDKELIIEANSKSFIEKILFYSNNPEIMKYKIESLQNRYFTLYTTESNYKQNLDVYIHTLKKLKQNTHIVEE